MKRAMVLWLALGLASVGCARPATSDGDGGGDSDADGDGDVDADGDADGEALPPCEDNSGCDDAIACTEDICGIGGVCRNDPLDARCEGEERCVPGFGCTDVQCETSADCDDGVFCNGAERCVVASCYPAEHERDCDDGDGCTTDYCSIGTDSCVHDPAPGCVPDGGPDGGPTPFDPEVHYAGTFDLAPAQSSSCGAATYDIRAVTMTSSASELAVQAGSFRLLQAPRPADGSFDVTYTQGSCGTYRLTGSFIDSDNFSARWQATFSGGCGSCDDQDVDVYGVRR